MCSLIANKFCKAVEKAQNRAVLITCGSIRDAEEIKRKLEQIPSKPKIRTLIEESESEAKGLSNPIMQNDIMVATRLASRGVDLSLDKEVLANGGLHVIVVSPAPNKRVEEQEFGRAGRKGQPGSGQAILKESELEAMFGMPGSGNYSPGASASESESSSERKILLKLSILNTK